MLGGNSVVFDFLTDARDVRWPTNAGIGRPEAIDHRPSTIDALPPVILGIRSVIVPLSPVIYSRHRWHSTARR